MTGPLEDCGTWSEAETSSPEASLVTRTMRTHRHAMGSKVKREVMGCLCWRVGACCDGVCALARGCVLCLCWRVGACCFCAGALVRAVCTRSTGRSARSPCRRPCSNAVTREADGCRRLPTASRSSSIRVLVSVCKGDGGGLYRRSHVSAAPIVGQINIVHHHQSPTSKAASHDRLERGGRGAS